MDMDKLKFLKPHIPFTVVERDLSKNPEMRKKKEFTDEDLKIDYSIERLKKGEIEIPVFKDSFIRPFFLKGRLLQYEMNSLGGGFYKFIFQNGKISPKPSDRRYPNKEIDRKNGGETTFWIGYDHEKRHYCFIDNEESFEKQYSVIENALMDDDVFDLLSQFELFVTTFFSNAYLTQHNMHGNGKKTVQNYYEVLCDLKNAFPMLKNYHQLMNIFNDIDDITFKHITNTLNEWEDKTEKYVSYIENELELTWTDNDMRIHYERFKPITNFYSMIPTTFWTRGYYVDPFEKNVFPNILEVHYQRQLSDSDHFESDETLKLQKQKIYADNIEEAEKKNKVIFIKNG